MSAFTREGLRYQVAVSCQPGNGPSLLMLHGFAGSHRSFEHLLPQLKGFSGVIRPDLAGHGLSLSTAADPAPRYALKKQLADLRHLLRDLAPDRLVIYGYSMGARLALQLAVSLAEKPEPSVTPVHLLLESGTAGLRTETERRERRDSDRRLARQILTDFEGFHQSWDTLPVFATKTPPSPEHTQTHRDTRAAQQPRHLAASLQAFGTGSMPALHEQLAHLSVPVTLLTGSYDTKFTAIARELLPLFGSTDKRHISIPDCGHRIHLENPERLVQLLNEIAGTK